MNFGFWFNAFMVLPLRVGFVSDFISLLSGQPPRFQCSSHNRAVEADANHDTPFCVTELQARSGLRGQGERGAVVLFYVQPKNCRQASPCKSAMASQWLRDTHTHESNLVKNRLKSGVAAKTSCFGLSSGAACKEY